MSTGGGSAHGRRMVGAQQALTHALPERAPHTGCAAQEPTPPSWTPPPPPLPNNNTHTTKTRSGPQRVRMSSGERPIGAAKGKQPNAEVLCQPPPPSPQTRTPVQMVIDAIDDASEFLLTGSPPRGGYRLTEALWQPPHPPTVVSTTVMAMAGGKALSAPAWEGRQWGRSSICERRNGPHLVPTILPPHPVCSADNSPLKTHASAHTRRTNRHSYSVFIPPPPPPGDATQRHPNMRTTSCAIFGTHTRPNPRAAFNKSSPLGRGPTSPGNPPPLPLLSDWAHLFSAPLANQNWRQLL